MLLVAVLWAVYLSECFVRWKPGDWVFRRTLTGAIRGIHRPDVTFWNERFAFVWTSPWPGHLAWRCSGTNTDGDTCRMRVQDAHVHTRWLRASAFALWLLLLVVFPVLVLSERFLLSLPWLVPAVIVAWLSTLGSFFRTRPSLELALTNSLSPVSLIAAPVAISIDTCSTTHPAIAAHVLCGTDEFVRIARLWHFDAESFRPQIDRLAAERGVTLLTPPADVEPGVSQYCARCHATFTDAARFCADCMCVALTPLNSASRSVECAPRYDNEGIPTTVDAVPDVRVPARERRHGRSSTRARHARRNHRHQAS
jgi:hypothetical protein